MADMSPNIGRRELSVLVTPSAFIEILLEFVLSDTKKVSALFFNEHSLTGTIINLSSAACSHGITTIELHGQVVH
jgi:hypothetical protein